MSDYLPKFKPGQSFTVQAAADITGGQIVTATGGVAGAESTTFIGVAGHDVATGRPVTVFADGVQRLTASAAIAAGALVKCAADGKVAAYTDGTDTAAELVGVALEAATADGDVIAVKMR